MRDLTSNVRQQQRRGMTAIEMLAATLLASLMLASVMGVLGGLVRQQRALQSRAPAPSWHRVLSAQLLWDLQNSRAFVGSPDGVRLTGFAGRDFGTSQPTELPTAVEYFLLDSDHDRFLVRREEHLGARTNDNWRIEVVCRGVQRIDFGSCAIDQAVINGLHVDRRNAEQPVADRVPVRIYDNSGGQTPLFDRQFILR
jgi:hypothetical protein